MVVELEHVHIAHSPHWQVKKRYYDRVTGISTFR